MKQLLQSYTAWATVALLRAGEDFDVQLLQWPGGSVIAAVLWAGARVRIAVRFAMRLGGARRPLRTWKLWRAARAAHNEVSGLDPLRRARFFAAGLRPDGRSARSIASGERCLHGSRS
jgi:hypothetical protein